MDRSKEKKRKEAKKPARQNTDGHRIGKLKKNVLGPHWKNNGGPVGWITKSGSEKTKKISDLDPQS